MIKHIVFFKLPSNNKTMLQTVAHKLKTLDAIPYVKSLEVGINFSKEQRAYDISMIVSFENKKDFHCYEVDIEHKKVVDYLKSLDILSKVVDYEI